MRSNKSLGNEFENWLCEYGHRLGFFAHKLTQSSSGQPADILFARNNIPLFVDAKNCEGVRFPFSRVEMNQRNAFKMLNRLGCPHTYFAFRFKVNDDYDYRYLSFKEVCELEKKMTGVSYNLCHSLEEMFGNILIDEVCKNAKSKPRATK